MMIRISANLGKKIPIPNHDYSSQQFGASLEIEISDADEPDVIKTKLKRLYSILRESVEEQIAASGKPPLHAEWSGGNGTKKEAAAPGRQAAATEAQRKAIFAICRAQGRDLSSVLGELKVKDSSELSVKEASALIDRLKRNGMATN